MHAAAEALLKSLNFGKNIRKDSPKETDDPVGKLAQVYETARNALEYRAQHLVRRAAIERILKRELVFSSGSKRISEILVQELRWARYTSAVHGEEIQELMEKYYELIKSGKYDREWLVGLVSAEIEEKLNPNSDYQKFTNFAFHVMKHMIRAEEISNIDLLLFAAVDKTYSQSDNQQIAFHIFKLISKQAGEDKSTEEILTTTWDYYKKALSNPLLNRLMILVRRQLGPMTLIRDMYFARPAEFEKSVQNEEDFKNLAKWVLSDQLSLMKQRMSTAMWRSLTYVFLTKMLFALILEVPLEKWIGGSVKYLALTINTLFPVAFMWILTAGIKLPGKTSQQKMIERAWEIMEKFDATAEEEEVEISSEARTSTTLKFFYAIYAILFPAIFALIAWGLIRIGFGLISIVVFVFFLSLVTFFAYRIRQTAQIYSYKPPRELGSSLGDMLLLPIVAVGSMLSRGVSRLNFLVFVFDFILEAPFKIILRFLDAWFSFISRKTEEAVG